MPKPTDEQLVNFMLFQMPDPRPPRKPVTVRFDQPELTLEFVLKKLDVMRRDRDKYLLKRQQALTWAWALRQRVRELELDRKVRNKRR